MSRRNVTRVTIPAGVENFGGVSREHEANFETLGARLRAPHKSQAGSGLNAGRLAIYLALSRSKRISNMHRGKASQAEQRKHVAHGPANMPVQRG
jgi:hypothetical protein